MATEKQIKYLVDLGFDRSEAAKLSINEASEQISVRIKDKEEIIIEEDKNPKKKSNISKRRKRYLKKLYNGKTNRFKQGRKNKMKRKF